MSDYQDGTLPLGTRMSLRLHFMMCRSCRSMERSMRETMVVLRQLRDEAPREPVVPSDEP